MKRVGSGVVLIVDQIFFRLQMHVCLGTRRSSQREGTARGWWTIVKGHACDNWLLLQRFLREPGRLLCCQIQVVTDRPEARLRWS